MQLARYDMDSHNKNPSIPTNTRINGPSVIIGLGKIQSYQWFASRQQEVIILKFYKMIFMLS